MCDFHIPKSMHVRESDVFSKQIDHLVAYGEEMTWQDDETITFVYSLSPEMMDDASLELPNEPSHEYLEEKKNNIRQQHLREEAERVRLYGTDNAMTKLLCHETAAGLDLTLWRCQRGEELRQQILVMHQLRGEGNYKEAHKTCVWLLDQNGRHGVGYDKALLQILKDTLAALSDEVHLSNALTFKLRLVSK